MHWALFHGHVNDAQAHEHVEDNGLPARRRPGDNSHLQHLSVIAGGQSELRRHSAEVRRILHAQEEQDVRTVHIQNETTARWWTILAVLLWHSAESPELQLRRPQRLNGSWPASVRYSGQKLWSRLLRDKDLTLDKAIEYYKAAKIVATQSQPWDEDEGRINAVRKASQQGQATMKQASVPLLWPHSRTPVVPGMGENVQLVQPEKQFCMLATGLNVALPFKRPTISLRTTLRENVKS